MANITKVPNGPLIKKKGPFKGSTLKTGGVVKKAQVGDTIYSKKTRTLNGLDLSNPSLTKEQKQRSKGSVTDVNKFKVKNTDGSIQEGSEVKNSNKNRPGEVRIRRDVITPKGDGSILFVTDYGYETDTIYTIIINETGELWQYTPKDIIVKPNITFKRYGNN